MNATIALTKNDHTYYFYCTAFSNPGVNLTLYDTNSMLPLTTFNNSYYHTYCYTNYGCYSYLTVYFQFADNSFDNMSSVTCAATSYNNLVFLSNSISRNVLVLQAGKLEKILQKSSSI